MFNVKCACGKANKNFKYDIGPMYVDECCKAAGYDDLGKRKSSGEYKAGTENPQQVADLVDTIQKQGQAPTINIVPTQPSVPAQQTELSGTKQEDKSSAADRALAMVGMAQAKLSKNKLSRLRVEELRTLAKARNLPVTDDMTRVPLTELLLKS